MNFYWSMLLPFENCPISPYKFSWILTLAEVRNIRILRMRLISAIMNFYGSHVIALQKLPNECSYKFSWILTLSRSYKHYNFAHALNFRYFELLLVVWYCPSKTTLSNERSYNFSWILTLTEVISIWILLMHIISHTLNFNWFITIALQKLSHERFYKFSWILILTEVIGIRILRMCIIYTIMNFYWSMLWPFKNCLISSCKFMLNFNYSRSYKHLNFAHALNFRHYELLLVPCYCPSKTVQWTFL